MLGQSLFKALFWSTPMLKVLILDDDPYWCEKHKTAIEAEGFEVCIFSNAVEAIQAAKTESSIQFAIIDHILLTEGTSDDPEELQHWQGLDVIAEIWRSGRNLIFVLITDAPKTWEQNGEQSLMSGTAYLRTALDQHGISIHQVIHKDEIRLRAEAEYGNLIRIFRRWAQEGTRSQIVVIERLNVEQVGIINLNSSAQSQIGIQQLDS